MRDFREPKAKRIKGTNLLFRVHLDDDALDEIRKASSRGLPLGSDRFREQVEAALGRRVGLRQRGRRETEPSNKQLPGQLGLDL